jgi:hypothetical protein
MVSSIQRPDEASNDSADEALIGIKLEHCSAFTECNIEDELRAASLPATLDS